MLFFNGKAFLIQTIVMFKVSNKFLTVLGDGSERVDNLALRQNSGMLPFVFHRTIVHVADTVSGSVSSFLCELFDIYTPKRYLRLANKLVVAKFHFFF